MITAPLLRAQANRTWAVDTPSLSLISLRGTFDRTSGLLRERDEGAVRLGYHPVRPVVFEKSGGFRVDVGMEKDLFTERQLLHNGERKTN